MRRVRYKFYVQLPLCQSIDFVYTASLMKRHQRFEVVKDYLELNPEEPYFLPLSIVDLSNLAPSRFKGDLPVFEGTYLLDRIPEQQRLDVISGRCFLFIDYSGEGAPLAGNIWMEFHSELANRSINPNQVVLLNENHSLTGRYHAWCRQSNVSPINVISYNHALYHFSGTINAAQYPQRDRRFAAAMAFRNSDAVRSRVFVCLNNMPRIHRVALITYLFDKNHNEKGYTSFLKTLDEQYRETCWMDVQALIGDANVTRAAFDNILSVAPIEADSAASSSRAGLTGLIGGEEIYTDSHISFVTESEFTNGSSLRFTEKILKPIANFHPFLGFGDPGMLQLLRDEGFETFSPIIDESYDTTQDPVARFQALLAEVERLCSMSSADLKRFWNMLWPRLEHNYVQLWDRTESAYQANSVHDQLCAVLGL